MTTNQLSPSRSQRRQFWLLFLPGASWLILFFVLPLLIVLVYSFFTRGPYGNVVYEFTTANYIRLSDAIYATIFTNSLWMAIITTLISLLVGYPLAYFIVKQSPRWRNVLLLLVIIPFWTNFLVRTYAIMVLFRTEGVVNILLQSLGIIEEPLAIMFTPFAVTFGLVYGYLPFMVLPLYASIEKFDFSLMEAAQDLGANVFRSFVRVMLPLTMPGVVAGCILVFIPAIGAFVTPDLLGGAKTMMIGNLTQQQFLKARNWPFGSATSIALMVIVGLATYLYFRYTDEEAR
ncbi:MAG: ABC transporter permease [Chloroflexota bacterium]